MRTISVASFTISELGNHICFSRAPLGEIGKELLVDELERLEIQSLLDLGIKQLEEVLEEELQEFFEPLIVAHLHLPSRGVDEKT